MGDASLQVSRAKNQGELKGHQLKGTNDRVFLNLLLGDQIQGPAWGENRLFGTYWTRFEWLKVA